MRDDILSVPAEIPKTKKGSNLIFMVGPILE
jgi:hypothetical protein